MNKLIDKIAEELKLQEEVHHGKALIEIMNNGHTLKAENEMGLEKGFEIATDIVLAKAKAYNESLLNDLVEAKKCCSEDSDCSQCIFGQIEDRCVLAELQNDRTVKTNADYIRNMSDEELAEMLNNTVEFEDEDEEPMKSIWDVRKQKSVDLHGSHGDILDWLEAEREG